MRAHPPRMPQGIIMFTASILLLAFKSLSNLFTEHPVIQSVGFVAMVVGSLSFQGRSARSIVLLQGLASAFWAIHFGFLGAVMGAVANALSVPRNAIYAFGRGKPWAESPFWPAFFTLAFVAGGVFSRLVYGESWILLLSISGQVISTFIFRLRDAQAIRWLSIAMSLCWLAYDALAGSLPGTLCEVMNQISIYAALWRFRGGRRN